MKNISKQIQSYNPVIFWDFDGTLGRRPWSSAMQQAIFKVTDCNQYTLEEIKTIIKGTFLWDQPEQAHHHLNEPEKWWAYAELQLTLAFQKLGFPEELAAKLAAMTHQLYIEPSSYLIYQDTIPALEQVIANKWRQIILSNHVPELPSILAELGLNRFFDYSLTSAKIGYEKPNPAFFSYAMELVNSASDIWMIGDNPVADIWGAEQVGIKAVLVRNQSGLRARYKAPDLLGAIKIIEEYRSCTA